jgi:hypothetical protein
VTGGDEVTIHEPDDFEEPEGPPEPPLQGSKVGGDVQLEGESRFAGRDYVAGMPPHLVVKLVEALAKNLSRGFLDPAKLEEMLGQFAVYHRQLHEWKELHNCLNEILNVLDQFAVQVDRSHRARRPLALDIYLDSWRPVNRQVDNLLAWASDVAYIGAKYEAFNDGTVQGERWSIEVKATRDDVMTHLRSGASKQMPDLLSSRMSVGSWLAFYRPLRLRFEWLDKLQSLTHEFRDASSRHLYITDKRLRDTASRLYELSTRALTTP